MKITDKRDEPRVMKVGDMPVGTKFKTVAGTCMRTDSQSNGYWRCVYESGCLTRFTSETTATVDPPPRRGPVRLDSLKVGAAFVFPEAIAPHVVTFVGPDWINASDVISGHTTQVNAETLVTPVDIEVVLR